MKKLYKVGIYCRLSVDDASNSAKAKNYIPADESVSIENQYELLSKFVMLNGWTELWLSDVIALVVEDVERRTVQARRPPVVRE